MPKAVIVNPFIHPDVIVHLQEGQKIVENRVTVGISHDVRLGAGAYTAEALKQHLWDIEIVDAVGDDVFGELTFNKAIESGFGMGHVVRFHGSHMFVLSVADEKSQGATMISSCPSDWQRSAQEVQISIAGAPPADIYYIWSWFWSYANANLANLRAQEVLQEIRAKAGRIILDPNWKPPHSPPNEEVKSLLNALPMIDILKLNQRDAAVIVGSKDPETTVRELIELGAPLVVLTLAGNGCVLGGRSVNGCVFVPSISVKTRNTTGAGDVFGGAFISDFTNHGDAVRAAHYASGHVSKFLSQS